MSRDNKPETVTVNEAICAAVSGVACVDQLKKLVPLDQHAWSFLTRIEASIRTMERFVHQQGIHVARRDTQELTVQHEGTHTLARIEVIRGQGIVVHDPEPSSKPTRLLENALDPLLVDFLVDEDKDDEVSVSPTDDRVERDE